MEVGDLIKFNHAHSSQPGFEYCADWMGLVIENAPDRVNILWTTDYHTSFTAYYESHVDAYKALEVISEGR